MSIGSPGRWGSESESSSMRHLLGPRRRSVRCAGRAQASNPGPSSAGPARVGAPIDDRPPGHPAGGTPSIPPGEGGPSSEEAVGPDEAQDGTQQREQDAGADEPGADVLGLGRVADLAAQVLVDRLELRLAGRLAV